MYSLLLHLRLLYEEILKISSSINSNHEQLREISKKKKQGKPLTSSAILLAVAKFRSANDDKQNEKYYD